MSNYLEGLGFTKEIPEANIELAKARIASNPAAFQLLLEACLADESRDKIFVNNLFDCFDLPLPFFKGINLNISEGGYQEITWSDLEDPSDAIRSVFYDLRERCIFGAVANLGKPDLMHQYISICEEMGVARVRWVNKIATNPGERQYWPLSGVMVAYWQQDDTWFTATPIKNAYGEVVGHNFRLLFKDASAVQGAVSGRFYTIKNQYSWKPEIGVKADFTLDSYSKWAGPTGPVTYFKSKLLNANPPAARMSALLTGPPAVGKTSLIKAFLAELSDYVVFRINPRQYPDFEYPTYLEKVIVWVEDCEVLLTARTQGNSQASGILEKLEFDPGRRSTNSGAIKSFGLIFTSNDFEKLDEASKKNPARFERVFLLGYMDGTSANQDRKVTVIIDGEETEATVEEATEILRDM